MKQFDLKNISITCLKCLTSAGIILAFLLLGKAIQWLTSLPIPGSIFGLLLLFLALNLRFISTEQLMPSANLLLNYITLFFVPVGVGLLQYTELLSQYWLAIMVSSVISTMAVLLSVGYCYQRLSK